MTCNTNHRLQTLKLLIQAVGLVWQNAHEWVRLNLRQIVDYYMRVEGIDLVAYVGITPECYDRGEVVTAGSTSWTDSTS